MVGDNSKLFVEKEKEKTNVILFGVFVSVIEGYWGGRGRYLDLGFIIW